jgi:hypothetical protein
MEATMLGAWVRGDGAGGRARGCATWPLGWVVANVWIGW